MVCKKEAKKVSKKVIAGIAKETEIAKDRKKNLSSKTSLPLYHKTSCFDDQVKHTTPSFNDNVEHKTSSYNDPVEH